jgi:YesN/AraC family two-component response regulator
MKTIREKGGEIDLMITDLVMPGMSGRQLIEKVHEQYPQMPIICSSGYVRPANREEEDLYLRKPFTSQQLLQKVKHALS